MNIDQSNKIIAEFDGWIKSNYDKLGGAGYYRKYGELSFYTEFEYDTSWDWLMPVVKKIYSKSKEHNQFIVNLQVALVKANIEEIYKAVVEFIKWYNKKQ